MSRQVVLHCLDGLGIGGAERQLLRLLRHAPADGPFDHVVCHLGPRRDLAGEFTAQGITVHDLWDGGRTPVRSVARLVRLIGRTQPALIHADHDYAKLCAGIAAGLLRVPLLSTMGNTLPQFATGGARGTSPSLRMRLLERVTRAVSAHAVSHFLAVSRAVRRDLIADGVRPEMISVVPRGLNLEEFEPRPPDAAPAIRHALGLADAGPVLLNVGRLASQKGQDVLIRAMPAIRRAYPRVCLLLAGDGPLRDRYHALAVEEEVAEHVRFLGIRHDVPALLRAADVFVFPSRREGAAGALLEAMATATPCVASRIPAVEEVLDGGRGGVLVEPERADLFADAVIALLADGPASVALGRSARQIVQMHYDIRRNAQAFLDLCADVAAGRQAAHAAAGIA